VDDEDLNPEAREKREARRARWQARSNSKAEEEERFMLSLEDDGLDPAGLAHEKVSMCCCGNPISRNHF
jgi:hypothetical protein